jgi:predicted transposase/invertase (TIGR01784 family)
MIESLVRGFLPRGWAARLDFSTLERAPGSFVSDDLQEERHADLVWRLRWKGRPEDPQLYLLLEFQSTPDSTMPLRLLTYVSLLLQALVRTGQAKPAGNLPLVLPIVIYNGRPAWRTPLDLTSLFAPLLHGPKRYVPRLRYVLLDEHTLDLDRPEVTRNLAAAIFRVETSETRKDFQRLVQEILRLFSEEDEELRRIVTTWLLEKVRRSAFKRIIVGSLEEAAMLEESILRWEKELRREGHRQGLREGHRTGQIEGMRRMLLKQMRLKFGRLPRSVRLSVEAIDRPTELERLAGRILKAKSLSELGLG